VWPDKSENTMGLGIGDLDGNGFPDIFIGTGSPTQSSFDLIFCGKRETTTITSVSLYRCGDFTRQQGKTRTHGIAVGDVNNDGRPDVYYSLGGPTGFDEEHAGPNSSRHYGALYINNKVNSSKGAVIHLRGTRSNPDAFGARITVRGSETHYYEVPSVQGYVSQNSAYIPITLGTSTQASVTVRWSPWHTETFTVRAGERRTVVESK